MGMSYDEYAEKLGNYSLKASIEQEEKDSYSFISVSKWISKKIGFWNAQGYDENDEKTYLKLLYDHPATRLDLFVGANGNLRFPFMEPAQGDGVTFNTDIAKYQGNFGDIINIDVNTIIVPITFRMPLASSNPSWRYFYNLWLKLLNPYARGMLKTELGEWEIYLNFGSNYRKQIELLDLTQAFDASAGYVQFNATCLMVKDMLDDYSLSHIRQLQEADTYASNLFNETNKLSSGSQTELYKNIKKTVMANFETKTVQTTGDTNE